MIYPAFHFGTKMTAKKVGNRWMVGGDYDTNGALILMPHEGGRSGWAWFGLRGAVLKFQDWASEAEVAEMAAEEADPIKQLDTRDDRPVRCKELERPYNKQTFYKYRGFAIRSQAQGGYNSNPYGSFDGWLRHPQTGDKIKWLSANRLKQLVRDIDRFWNNYKAAA
tara:strand:+ start:43 stop:540 length:498 start_codon:yes stop_codon:yes gene_type:complete